MPAVSPPAYGSLTQTLRWKGNHRKLMNALSLVAYTAALVFSGLGVYALIQSLYSVQNRLFAGVCFLLALYLLRFAERDDLTRRIGVQLALWLPTAVFLLLQLVLGIRTLYVAFVPSPYGWSRVHSNSPASYAYMAFALALMLIPAFILSRSTQHRNRTGTRCMHTWCRQCCCWRLWRPRYGSM